MRVVLLVFLALGLSGCWAKKSYVDTELSRLRTEMQTGDTQLAARVDQNAQRVAALETAMQQMRTEFGAQIEELKGEFAGMVVFNLPVHFEFDRSDLREADRPVLEKFAAVVKEYYPGAVITVEGFTDPAGSVAYNQRLGQARANEVMEFLTTQGMSAEMMRGVSYGEARNRQVAPGMAGDRPGAEANRRVTFVVDSRPTATTTT